MQYKALESTFYFHFGLNDITGEGADGASPLYDVRLCGAAADAAPVLSGTPTLLTHANYPAGCFEIAVAATTANGFIADNQYAVFCTALVSSVNPTGFAGTFTTTALLADTDIPAAVDDSTSVTSILATVNHADYGNAHLVRSTTPANTLTVDASHRALSDLASILGTALTETAGQIAAAFKKFFDKATPTGTINSLPDAVPGATGGLPTTNGTKVNQTVDLTTGQSIAVSDKTGFSLSSAGILAIWDQLLTGLVAVGSIGKKFADWVVGTIDTYTGNTKQTGDAYARLGLPAGASIAADLAVINGYVDSLETRLTAARAGYLDELGAANIPADIDTLLTRIVGTLLTGNHSPQSGDGYAIVSNGTYGNAAIRTLVNTVAGYLDTEISDMLTILNKLDAMIGIDGAYTAASLVNAPTGVGGFTVDDAARLLAIFNKLPSKAIITGTDNVDGNVQIDEATGTPANSAGVTTLLTRVTAVVALASELALVKAKTEQLTFTEPNRVDATATGGGGTGDATLTKQNEMIDKLKGMMSKVYTMLTAVGTFDPATDSLEAIRERIEQTNIIPVSSVCCRVYEYCFMPDGVTPAASVSGEAQVVSLPENTGTMLITGQIIKPVYDSSTGLLYWDLTIGASVVFNLSAYGYVNYTKTIPDASAVRLSAII